MSRADSILGDKYHNANCYEYLPLRSGYANANFVGESANPIYNGVKPPKQQRSASQPVSLDVLAVNSARLYPGNHQNTARAIIQQYLEDEKVFINPRVNLETPAKIEVINQASNIARPATGFINRGDLMLAQTISQDALNNNIRLQNYQIALLRLNAPSSQKLMLDIQQIAETANVDLKDYSPFKPSTRESRVDVTMRNIEALLAIGADVSIIDSALIRSQIKPSVSVGSSSQDVDSSTQSLGRFSVKTEMKPSTSGFVDLEEGRKSRFNIRPTNMSGYLQEEEYDY